MAESPSINSSGAGQIIIKRGLPCFGVGTNPNRRNPIYPGSGTFWTGKVPILFKRLSQPVAKIAAPLNTPTETVLHEIKSLQDSGLIRRIAPIINYRALGFTATLVAAHIPEKKIPQVTEAVNSINHVSHNYLRDHYYNLWFTLIAPSKTKINHTLANLSADCNCVFHSLPALRTFKLNVRFDADSDGRRLMQNNAKIPQTNPVNLSENEKLVLSKLQTGLKTVQYPFEPLAADGLNAQDVLNIIQ